jgi:hypothetical protein
MAGAGGVSTELYEKMFESLWFFLGGARHFTGISNGGYRRGHSERGLSQN